MRIADRWFETKRIDDRITLLWEPHVARVEQCNMWHVRGRDSDLLVDAGMGISSLKSAMSELLNKPLIAVATHSHMDHVGSLHEFEHRLAHPLEAHQLANSSAYPVLCSCRWPGTMRADIEAQGYEVPDILIDAYPHEGFDPFAFRTRGAQATRLIDEGDVVDLGDTAFEVLHLPGHSPGSIGLWEKNSGTLFSGDAIYDGPLLDKIEGANLADYQRTMQRLRHLPVEVVHGGHDPSFGRARMHELTDHYLRNSSRG
ncbi:MBL fold metallo-hydrolase [Pseudomonas fluorescens]|uniref:Hydroxyacylglutathione hydrolase n=1 Tax=Pseudomonas fluorescens TaxID=294 RepID=A0A5E7LSC5_PSEFL|nr:MBL fold metallo-hydrolase [Pseudomonas fluorescens]VVP14685.1 Hydroxyacylglutathione hydrolase [Pseudomonas fluorescens]